METEEGRGQLTTWATNTFTPQKHEARKDNCERLCIIFQTTPYDNALGQGVCSISHRLIC